MPSVTAGYGMLSDFITFFWKFSWIIYIFWNVITSSNFHKSCVKFATNFMILQWKLFFITFITTILPSEGPFGGSLRS